MSISSHGHDHVCIKYGRVEVVDGDARKKLDKPGGIAAMLRY